MMALPLIAGLLLAVALVVYAIYPLLVARRERASLAIPAGDQTLENLLFEREATLTAIKDLQFEHAMGKLSEPDFRELDARYRQRAVEIFQRLDALGAPADEREDELDTALDRWIEEAIAAARATREPRGAVQHAELAHFCAQCGRAVAAGDRFCAGCGRPIRVETPAPS